MAQLNDQFFMVHVRAFRGSFGISKSRILKKTRLVLQDPNSLLQCRMLEVWEILVSCHHEDTEVKVLLMAEISNNHLGWC